MFPGVFVTTGFYALLVGYLAAGQRCRSSCGEIPIQFPFGIDSGCGDVDHGLDCDKSYRLTLKSSEFPNILVTGINYTAGYLILEPDPSLCNLRMPSSSYNTSAARVCSSHSDLPETLGLDNCLFEHEEAFSTEDFKCFNFTQAPVAPEPYPNNPGFEYVAVPWIVNGEVQSYCDNCNQTTSGTCGYNTRGAPTLLCFGSTSRKNKTAVIAGVSAAAAIFFLASILAGCFVYKKRQAATQRRKYILDGGGAMSPLSDAHFLPSRSPSNSSHGNSTRFTLKQLQEATDNFSEAGRLGDGGFGTVYKGKLPDGRLVAVKKLNPWNAQGKFQFDNEVIILSQVTHPHLVRLYGCCLEGRELLLVYEFVSNGTLADHIHDCRAGFMDWEKRLCVVTETAEALAFLHTTVCPPIFHRDVKSTNILIDESYHAKVGDFGLSRLVPSLELTHITTAPQGTPGYLDPEYHQSYQLTDKSDVYSLGVVLMEIVSSQRAVDMSRDRKEINLAALAVSRIQCGQLDKLVDERLGTEFDPVKLRMVEGVAELAFECLSAEKEDRPCMRDVAGRLRRIWEEGKRMYLERSSEDDAAAAAVAKTKTQVSDDHRVGFVSESPTSVQLKWPSATTSPNDSSSSI